MLYHMRVSFFAHLSRIKPGGNQKINNFFSKPFLPECGLGRAFLLPVATMLQHEIW